MYIYRFEQFLPIGDFAVQVIRNNGERASTEFHSHDFHEVVLVCGGRGIHETPAETYPLKAGDVLVIPKGKSHCYPVSNDLMIFNFIIEAQKLNFPILDSMFLPGFKILTGRENREAHFSVTEETLSKLVPLAFELQEELKSKESGYQFAATAIFMKIILMMAREFPGNDEGAGTFSGNDVFKIVEFMEKNLAHRISMKALARQIHVSEPTLFRHFKNYLGCTPNSYILQLRVSKAAEMLTKSDMSLDEIAFKTGFCDANHLSKTFIRFAGMAPSKYKKLNLK